MSCLQTIYVYKNDVTLVTIIIDIINLLLLDCLCDSNLWQTDMNNDYIFQEIQYITLYTQYFSTMQATRICYR